MSENRDSVPKHGHGFPFALAPGVALHLPDGCVLMCRQPLSDRVGAKAGIHRIVRTANQR